MAYITKKRIKGLTYYYAEECGRKNGKVKRVWQKYLGSIEKIIAAVERTDHQPAYAEIFKLGCPAAYLNIIEEFDLIQTLDDVLPKRNQRLSLGFYLILAAINRGIDAVSKRSIWRWFQTTIFLRVFPQANGSSLSSQRFWDNMDLIDTTKIENLWMKIVNRVLAQENIDITCTSYDGTNFYSFIGSFNARCSIAKRGKNKQGRKDLRQINYALFCTRNDQFPLYFDVYEGNRHDSKEFGAIIKRFQKAFKHREVDKGTMTIVFDKGNNSPENIKCFTKDSGYHFVGSVKPDDHKDLACVSNQDKRFIPLCNPRLEQVKAWRTSKVIYKKELTVVVTFNNNLYTAQIQSINNEINKCLGKLSCIASKLSDRRSGIVTKGKCPTVSSIKAQTLKIRSGQYMKGLINVEVDEINKIPNLQYSVNATKFVELSDTYLGKNIIITDNHSWTTEDIILTYRSQYVIEDAFKQMKDRKIGSWWPMHHWTDQKIFVHGFYCSLTLLIRSLIMRKVKNNGIKISMGALHNKLNSICEVLNVFPGKGKQKMKNQSVVSKMDDLQKKLFNLFEMRKYLNN
ncbi:MAG: IS1634 family transposase [Candidatus Peribacteraceae bacterium]|nr:IS1634 family transposase [Candidatus Peribacteraceae bacterium]